MTGIYNNSETLHATKLCRRWEIYAFMMGGATALGRGRNARTSGYFLISAIVEVGRGRQWIGLWREL
jgi:hypothetical protein